jgi:methyltransferase (TIGR00027 family)
MNAPAEHPKVIDTARWVAAARAREHERPDRLFEDAYAARLAGDTGPAELAGLEAVTGDAGYQLALRTRFLDDVMSSVLANRPIRQVVVPAAGMDARAFRLRWPAPVRWYEIDLPPLVDAKREGLSGVSPSPGLAWHCLASDLRDAWELPLTTAGHLAAEPTLWLAEGLFVYLDAASVDSILSRIARLSAPGSIVLADFAGAAMFRTPAARPWLDALAARGIVWQFGTDEPEALLERHGFRASAIQASEAAALYPARGAMPIIPRDVEAPRCFIALGERLL